MNNGPIYRYTIVNKENVVQFDWKYVHRERVELIYGGTEYDIPKEFIGKKVKDLLDKDKHHYFLKPL